MRFSSRPRSNPPRTASIAWPREMFDNAKSRAFWHPLPIGRGRDPDKRFCWTLPNRTFSEAIAEVVLRPYAAAPVLPEEVRDHGFVR